MDDIKSIRTFTCLSPAILWLARAVKVARPSAPRLHPDRARFATRERLESTRTHSRAARSTDSSAIHFIELKNFRENI